MPITRYLQSLCPPPPPMPPTDPQGSRMPPAGDVPAWVVIALIAAAVLLRLALADYPFWFDEYASLIFAREPLHHLWGPWMVRETNPPLFYTLAKGWHGVAGDSVVALRLLPIAAAAASMALLALIARRAYGAGAVVPVLVLYGLSASAIFISHQFRGYIFCELGILVALVGLLGIVQQQGSVWRNHALYVAGSAIAIYSHTSLLLWPAVATAGTLGWFALFRREQWWRVAGRLILADLCLLALSGWLIWIALQQLHSGAANIGWLHPHTLNQFWFLISQNTMLAFHPSIGYHSHVASKAPKRIVQLMLVLAAVRTARHPPTQLFAALYACEVAALWLAQGAHPLATDRTVHWLSLFSVLVLAGGIGQIRSPRLRLLALAAPAAALAANLAAEHDRLVIETFPGPMAGQDPARIAVMTAHEADAVTFLQACRMYYRAASCPIQLIAMDSPRPEDSWAKDMLQQPLLTPDAARSALPQDKAIFVYRHGGRDPLKALGIAVPPTRYSQLIRGPLTADQIRGIRPLPPAF